MKTKSVLLFFCIIISTLYANDTYVFNNTSGTLLTNTNDKNISLLKEEIEVYLYKKYFSLSVTMYFNNKSSDKEVKVGFPVFSLTSDKKLTPGDFHDFKTYVNDIEQSFINEKTSDFENDNINSFYIKNVLFEHNSITKTKITYNCNYSYLGHWGTVAPYLFGTGKTWGNAPWTIYLTIHNLSENVISSVKISDNKKIYKLTDYKSTISNSNDTTTIIINDILPANLNAMFEIWTEPFLWGIDDIENHYLKIQPDIWDLKALTNYQLSLIRNCLYAKKGYIFKSKQLLNYFNQFDWYKPKYEKDNFTFNDNELKLLKIIKEEEKNR